MKAPAHGRSRRQGFTLIELMITWSLMVVFCTVTIQMGLRIRRERDQAESYAADLRELRAALRSLAADVRVARDVARTDDTMIIAVEGGAVRYRVQDGALVRKNEQGAERAVARSVAALETHTRGDLVTLSLRLRRRSESAAVPASVSTQVRLRSRAAESR